MSKQSGKYKKKHNPIVTVSVLLLIFLLLLLCQSYLARTCTCTCNIIVFCYFTIVDVHLILPLLLCYSYTTHMQLSLRLCVMILWSRTYNYYCVCCHLTFVVHGHIFLRVFRRYSYICQSSQQGDLSLIIIVYKTCANITIHTYIPTLIVMLRLQL